MAVAATTSPGHGDTAVDSHTGLPWWINLLPNLKNWTLPFKKAMGAGVDLLDDGSYPIPTNWKDQVVSKETGEKIYVPATLSDDILTGLAHGRNTAIRVWLSPMLWEWTLSLRTSVRLKLWKWRSKAGVDLVLMPTTLRSKTDFDQNWIPLLMK